MSNQQDMEAIVNLLLRQIKQQPVKTDVQMPTWIEKRFGTPKSGEEVLWRLAWLIVVPAVFTLLLLPILDWCWSNGFPWITVLVGLSIAFTYWLSYFFASSADPKLQRLVEVQFCIPAAVCFFVLVWEWLSHAN